MKALSSSSNDLAAVIEITNETSEYLSSVY